MNQFEEGLLRYLSKTQLNKIQSVKIGIGGAGGLGSNVAVFLVRSGFKNFEIIDFDDVEASNLNRQHYFIDDIAQPKATTLKKYLLKINPDLNISIHKTRWDAASCKKLFSKCNFIVEAFDCADQKKSFVEYYQDKAEFIVSGNGIAGLTKKKDIEVKKVNNIFIVGDNSTDVADGHPPMAPRVAMCAATMAQIILDLTVNQPSRLVG